MELKEIPLAFIDTDESGLKVNVEYNPDFCEDRRKRVNPYDEFEDEEPVLFDETGNVLHNLAFRRVGRKFVYEPAAVTEFSPCSFTVTPVIKKAMEFSPLEDYDIKLEVAEDGSTPELSKRLISIFGDAWKRGICPPNIRINGGAMSPEALCSGTIKDADFVVCETVDGESISTQGKETKIDIRGILSQHTNIILFVEKFEDLLTKEERKGTSYIDELENRILYRRSVYQISDRERFGFDITKEHSMYPKEEFQYQRPHPAVLVLEKENAGTVIVFPKAVLNNLADNAGLLYELLLQVFLSSYTALSPTTSWITDQPVDYVNGRPAGINIRHRNININRLASDRNIGKAFVLTGVSISNTNVKFLALNQSGSMLFAKTGGVKDPEKADGEKSYYTSRHTVVNCGEEGVFVREEPFHVNPLIADNRAWIVIEGYRSTKHKLHSYHKQRLPVEYNNVRYVICAKPTTAEISTEFSIVPEQDYDREINGEWLARVVAETKPELALYDLRIAGGGLPEGETDDFDMLDIGHVCGRPYRPGSVEVIRLPARLYDRRERIEAEVRKHIAAGDYPVFLYE